MPPTEGRTRMATASAVSVILCLLLTSGSAPVAGQAIQVITARNETDRYYQCSPGYTVTKVCMSINGLSNCDVSNVQATVSIVVVCELQPGLLASGVVEVVPSGGDDYHVACPDNHALVGVCISTGNSHQCPRLGTTEVYFVLGRCTAIATPLLNTNPTIVGSFTNGATQEHDGGAAASFTVGSPSVTISTNNGSSLAECNANHFGFGFCASFDPQRCSLTGVTVSTTAYVYMSCFLDVTLAPTAAPTAAPTEVPTTAPPTFAPTFAPTAAPTEAPTARPTVPPTAVPTTQPTAEPTAVPTTAAPTTSPTTTPTGQPTATHPPTATPTNVPTIAPTEAAATGASGSDGGGSGVVIGIVVAVVVLVAVIAYLAINSRRERNDDKKQSGGLTNSLSQRPSPSVPNPAATNIYAQPLDGVTPTQPNYVSLDFDGKNGDRPVVGNDQKVMYTAVKVPPGQEDGIHYAAVAFDSVNGATVAPDRDRVEYSTVVTPPQGPPNDYSV